MKNPNKMTIFSGEILEGKFQGIHLKSNHSKYVTYQVLKATSTKIAVSEGDAA